MQKLLEQLSGRSNQKPPTLRPALTNPDFYGLDDLPPPPRRQPRPILDGLAWLWKTWQDTSPTQTRTRRPVSSQSSTGTLTSNEPRPVPLPRPAIGLFPFGSIAPQSGLRNTAAVDDSSEDNGDAIVIQILINSKVIILKF